MLQELLCACDDVEMLEEMIGVKRDKETGEIDPKQRKSRLNSVDFTNTR